jgi:tight adherence protein C
MDFAAILPWAVFAAFACGAWAIVNFLANKSSRADERLEELRNPLMRGKDKSAADDPRGQSGVGTMMEKAAPALSKALQPKSELEQSKLKVSLANAGFMAIGAYTAAVLAKRLLEVLPALALDPVQFNDAAIDERLQRRVQSLSFAGDVECL